MIKEIKYGSYSAVPSDHESSDGDLAAVMGAVCSDGALQPVEPPKVRFTLGVNKVVICIHKTSEFTHYIVHDTSFHKLYWLDSADAAGSVDAKLHFLYDLNGAGVNDVTCVGNTIVLALSSGLEYFFWRDAAYRDLGSKPPFTTIQFGLKGNFESYPSSKNNRSKPDGYGKYEDVDENGITDGWIIWKTSFYKNSFPCPYVGYKTRTPYTGDSFSAEDMYTESSQSDYDSAAGEEDNSNNTASVVNSLTNLVLGAMNKFLQVKGTDKDKFIMPFLVRYAYRMYDGSHIMHSVPVLLIPNSKAPVCWWRDDSSIQGVHSSDKTYARREPFVYARISAFVARLVRRIINVPEKLYDWKDLITGIDIFVSDKLYNYDMSGHVFGWERMTTADQPADSDYPNYFSDGNVSYDTSSGVLSSYARLNFLTMHKRMYDWSYYAPRYRFSIPEFDQAKINKSVEECSLFYKVAGIDFDKLIWKDGDTVKTAASTSMLTIKDVEIEEGTLKALTSRERLEDDYKSHYTKTCTSLYSYNSRLNLGHVSETIDSSANHPLAMFPILYIGTPPRYWNAVIEYNKNGRKYYSEQRTAASAIMGQDCDFPLYIFVPDTDAQKVYLTLWRAKDGSTLDPDDNASLIGGAGSDIKNEGLQAGTVDQQNAPALAALASGGDTVSDKNDEGTIVIPSIDDAKSDSGLTTGKDFGLTADGWQTSDGVTTRLNTGVYVVELKQHTGLNGAVWFKGYDTTLLTSSSVATLQRTTNTIEYQSKIYTTEVNNPFRFPVGGINTVGTGSIMGIVTAAKALSQGQFGQFPLYAFSDDGVWALEITASGSYSAKQPISRDVCINPASITQLDSAVLFASDRGIMRISGSTVSCISDALNGKAPFDVSTLPGIGKLVDLYNAANLNTYKLTAGGLQVDPFMDFIGGCKMIYDYTHQRVIVFNKRYAYAYVYALDSQNWGMRQNEVADTLNSYPQALAQDGNGNLVDFSETDASEFVALVVTRPLNLDNANELKTVSAVIQRGYCDLNDVAQVLYGSRDLSHWHAVWSSANGYMRGFSGTPYKYFRIALVARLGKGQSLFGCSVNARARDTNQLR